MLRAASAKRCEWVDAAFAVALDPASGASPELSQLSKESRAAEVRLAEAQTPALFWPALLAGLFTLLAAGAAGAAVYGGGVPEDQVRANTRPPPLAHPLTETLWRGLLLRHAQRTQLLCSIVVGVCTLLAAAKLWEMRR